jgi:hypothetical protein
MANQPRRGFFGRVFGRAPATNNSLTLGLKNAINRLNVATKNATTALTVNQVVAKMNNKGTNGRSVTNIFKKAIANQFQKAHAAIVAAAAGRVPQTAAAKTVNAAATNINAMVEYGKRIYKNRINRFGPAMNEETAAKLLRELRAGNNRIKNRPFTNYLTGNNKYNRWLRVANGPILGGAGSGSQLPPSGLTKNNFVPANQNTNANGLGGYKRLGNSTNYIRVVRDGTNSPNWRKANNALYSKNSQGVFTKTAPDV